MQTAARSLLRSATARPCLGFNHNRSLVRPLIGLCVLFAVSGPVAAQSTVGAQGDWNGNYGFTSSADRNLRLLQADIIRKSEEGYYEGLSRQTYNVTSTTYANTTNSSTTEIGQQTTTIGAVNTATNTIDIRDSTRIDLSLDNSSNSTGCQNGAISIDSRPAEAGAATCN